MTEVEDIEHEAVYIIWADAASREDQTWQWIEGTDTPLVLIHTLGFIKEENSEKVSVMMNMTEGGAFSGDITIPKGCIISRQVLALA